MAERNVSYSQSLAFPYLGENSRDPLLDMNPKFAVSLVNFFPQGSFGELRKGYRSHSSSLGSSSVETLATYASTSASYKLIGCANNRIYDATTYGGTASSLASGFTSNRWQTVNYLNKLILVNGADQPQQYDGTTVSAANYTGIADDANLIDVIVYKERLYFLEKNSSKFWYGSAGAVTGALTSFECGDFIRKGGYLLASASWTTSTGAGLTDLYVLVSSEGEVLTYSGTDPATDFALEGRYFIPKPMGRRCVRNIGADLFILHEQGVTSLQQLIQGVDVAAGFTQFTDAISPTFTAATSLYGSNLGWEVFFYPAAHWGIVNVPIASLSQSKQFVLNTQTQAWCQFTGLNALCWCEYNGKPYFGGSDGKVYEANVGGSDNGAAIDASMKFAFNYFGNKAQVKLFHFASANIIGTNDARLLFSVDVDGSNNMTTDSIDITEQEGSEWDTSPWDTTPWGQENFYSTATEGIDGLGRAGALKISGKFKNASIKIAGAQIIFEIGGYL